MHHLLWYLYPLVITVMDWEMISLFLSYHCLICSYGVLTGIKVDTNKQTKTHKHAIFDLQSLWCSARVKGFAGFGGLKFYEGAKLGSFSCLCKASTRSIYAYQNQFQRSICNVADRWQEKMTLLFFGIIPSTQLSKLPQYGLKTLYGK